MAGILAQTSMEVRLLLRSAESFLVTLGIPVGVLLFFSTVDVLPTGDRDAVTFLVPGVLAISVMSTAFVAQGIQTAFERKYGILKRLGATPLGRRGYLVAKALSTLAVLAIQAVLVLVIAVVGLDWTATGGAVGVLLGLVVGTFTFTSLGLLVAGTLRAEGTLAVVNGLYVVLIVVSGVMFESDALPGRLAGLGALLPSGALAEVLRTSLEDGTVAFGALALLAAWGVSATAVASRAFHWEP